jgi:hypothetical protein
MFPLPTLLYVKIGVAVALLLGSFAWGWHIRNVDFIQYKVDVEAAAKAQDAYTQSIKKQHELVTKGIQDDYDAKLAAIRNYYKSTSVWNNNGRSTMPGISTAPSISDVVTAYNVLAGQCAETTAQAVELQKWINEQIGIK